VIGCPNQLRTRSMRLEDGVDSLPATPGRHQSGGASHHMFDFFGKRQIRKPVWLR
jgi:hypothetical protein